jgi:hypothetical protein
MKRTAILFILVAVSVHAADLPNAPSAVPRPIDHSEDMIVHNTPSFVKQRREPLKDWKFWAGTGVLVGAMLYDQQKTLDGLKTTSCVELNGDNPRPGRGGLMARNLPVVAGLTIAKYLMWKYGRAPRWSAEAFDAVGATIHIHDGLKWNSCR